jgi:tetratricopeptide (TPR) repeat protein
VRNNGLLRQSLEIILWRTESATAIVRYGFKACAAVLILFVIAGWVPQAAFAEQSTSLNSQAQTAFLIGTADLKKGDFQGAVTAFEQFLQLDKNFGPAYLNLGLAYHSLKQFEKAIPLFTKALELDPQLESAALFLGIDYYFDSLKQLH